MNYSEAVYWQLLRAGLWDDAGRIEFDTCDSDCWRSVLKFSANTGTMGLVADGIALLPPEKRPGKKVLEAFLKERMRLMMLHKRHNKTIYSFFKQLGEFGFQGVLLKGQGNSLNYPHPDARHCGDIDIYIGVDKIDALVQTLEDHGIVYEEEVDDNDKHAVIYYDGLGVELHRHATFIDNAKANDRFQTWWNERISAGCDAVYVTEDGGISKEPLPGSLEVLLPDPTANEFFLFYHLFSHFISPAVSLKQFCDLAMHLRVRHAAVDEGELERRLVDLNLMQVWRVFGEFMRQYLGLAPENIPFYEGTTGISAKVGLVAERIRENCLRRKKDKWERPKNRIGRKIHSYFHYHLITYEILRIFPRQALEHLWFSTCHGMKVLFSSKNRDNTHEKYLARTGKGSC